MEEEPKLNVILHGEEVELNRQNTSLFTHLGAAAMFDHVYIVISEEPPQSTYIPVTAQAYPSLRDFLRAHHFPRHEDLLEASEMDKKNLIDHWLGDLATSASFPEDWETGNAA